MTRKPASNWALLKNSNVSYFIGYDAEVKVPQSILSGDRNIKGAANNNPCRVFPGAMGGVITKDSEWEDTIHRLCGNIGFADGRVEQVNTQRLRESAMSANQDNGNNHSRFPGD